jgi:transposase-like protein
MSKRRRFSEKKKVEILRRHLLEGEALSDVCDEYDLSPSQFYRWQKKFFEYGQRGHVPCWPGKSPSRPAFP